MTPIAKQLLDAQQSGVYQLVRSPDEVERAARAADLTVFRIDIGHTRDKKSFLAPVAQALHFPNWFGGNWDALHDCLTDLDWLSTKTGYVLIFENGDHFATRNNLEFDDAKSVLLAATEYWKSEGRPFWALIEVSSKCDSGLPKWPT